MSVEVKWTDKGATISCLNAVKEFPVLTNEDVEAAIEDGRLDTRQGECLLLLLLVVVFGVCVVGGCRCCWLLLFLTTCCAAIVLRF